MSKAAKGEATFRARRGPKKSSGGKKKIRVKAKTGGAFCTANGGRTGREHDWKKTANSRKYARGKSIRGTDQTQKKGGAKGDGDAAPKKKNARPAEN